MESGLPLVLHRECGWVWACVWAPAEREIATGGCVCIEGCDFHQCHVMSCRQSAHYCPQLST